MKMNPGRQFARSFAMALIFALSGWQCMYVATLSAQSLHRDRWSAWSVLLENDQPDSLILLTSRELAAEAFPAEDRARLLLLRGKGWRAKSDHAAAVADFRQAARLLQACAGQVKDTLYAENCLLLGLAFANRSEYDSAFVWQGRALEYSRSLYGSAGLKTADVLNIHAGLFAGCSDFKTAIELRLEGLRIAEMYPEAALQRLRFCNNLALLYKEGGDREAADAYFLRALSEASLAGNDRIRAAVQDNYAVFLCENRQFEQVAGFLAKSGAWYAGVQDTALLYDHFLALGLCYYWRDMPDSARYYHELRLTALGKRPRYDITLRAHTLFDLAEAYWRKGDFAQAFALWQETVEIERAEFGPFFSLLYKGYRRQGLCKKKMGQPEAAFRLFEQSLAANRYDGHSITSVFHPVEAAKTLLEAGRLCRETGRLDAGLRFLQMADSALYMQRKWLQDDYSNLHFAELAAEICDQGLQICMELYAQRGKAVRFAEAAFLFMEHTKSVELHAAAGHLQLGLQYGVQNDLLTAEYSLRQQLRSAIARETRSRSADSAQQDALHRIFQIKDSLAALQEAYRLEYPNYFLYKYAQPQLSADSLIRACRQQARAYLACFQGEEHLYLVAADSGGLYFFRRDISRATLSALADTLCAILSRCPADLSDHEVEAAALQYARIGVRLYDALLRPLDSVLSKNIPLVVCPHADLYRFPFEVLLESAPDQTRITRYHTYPYSLKNRRFSYTYSYSLLPLLQTRQGKPGGEMLGIMPATALPLASDAPRRDDAGLEAWIAGIGAEEKKYLTDKRPDMILPEPGADKADILRMMTNFRIVHVLTHGEMPTPETPGLLLTPTGEYARLWEIYALPMQAEMVVLSACGANLGRLHQTEGVLSLGRGFLYAGAGSVVSTAWSVPDRESGLIMAGFYDGLFAGRNKDEALALSKRAYMDAFRGLEAHPFYWAAYTVWGDVKRVF
jgi:CHAT domain-containing protein/Tfp pilus assembly protein PilF